MAAISVKDLRKRFGDFEAVKGVDFEVETGEGITEIALTCHACGTAWPVACVVDWSTRS